MNLKFYRVDIPCAHVMTFTTYASSEEEALNEIYHHSLTMLNGYWSGFSDSRYRVEVDHSQLFFSMETKRIRSADPGTEEEKRMVRVRMRPSVPLVTMEPIPDER